MEYVEDSKYLCSCDSPCLVAVPVGVYVGKLGVELYYCRSLKLVELIYHH